MRQPRVSSTKHESARGGDVWAKVTSFVRDSLQQSDIDHVAHLIIKDPPGNDLVSCVVLLNHLSSYICVCVCVRMSLSLSSISVSLPLSPLQILFLSLSLCLSLSLLLACLHYTYVSFCLSLPTYLSIYVSLSVCLSLSLSPSLSLFVVLPLFVPHINFWLHNQQPRWPDVLSVLFVGGQNEVIQGLGADKRISVYGQFRQAWLVRNT